MAAVVIVVAVVGIRIIVGIGIIIGIWVVVGIVRVRVIVICARLLSAFRTYYSVLRKSNQANRVSV
jgi:hypothetical protein